MEDGQILRMLLDRNDEALRHLADKYGAAALKIASSVLKDRRDAEETLSDAYLAVWNSIPPDRPEVLCAYLYKTVRNLALHRLDAEMTDKRKINRLTTPIDELGDCFAGGDVEAEVDERQLSALIDSFLSGLDADDRRMFVCRYFCNMKYVQIAKKFGVGLSRVKMSVKRTKEKLRVFLKKEGY
ncbi:MAG: sigma-70 family RNA polymerase sigma factor [Clostridia bacterium]|nr:sigma-70 family RNA polymerase sigma factor [Clostridia bacterium]